MSLKNGFKSTTTVAKCVLDNDCIITLVGELMQTSTKLAVHSKIVRTTPGGKVLEEYDTVIPQLFDNQGGIRKEFYMGWSICQAEDKDVYDMKLGVKYAKKKFSRPIVTYNFTYLNKDQVDCLMRNEIDHIINKYFAGAKVVSYEIVK